MPHDLMTSCEQRKAFLQNGEYVKQWREVSVSMLTSGNKNDIRCRHCHGAVRVHKQQVEHGPTDHVEHLHRQDSENCLGGFHFNGNHQLSANPIS